MFQTVFDIALTIAPFAFVISLVVALFTIKQSIAIARWEADFDRCFRIAYQAKVEPYVILNAMNVGPRPGTKPVH